MSSPPQSEEKPPLTFYRELGDPAPRPAATGAKESKKGSQARSGVAAKAADAASAKVFWEVRVCSLPREVMARLERSKLLKKYSRVEIESVVLAGKGTWYRVKIVGIRDRRTAERYQQELKRGGQYKPLIFKHTQG